MRLIPPIKTLSEFAFFKNICFSQGAKYRHDEEQIKRLEYLRSASMFDSELEEIQRNFILALTEREYAEFMAEYVQRKMS